MYERRRDVHFAVQLCGISTPEPDGEVGGDVLHTAVRFHPAERSLVFVFPYHVAVDVLYCSLPYVKGAESVLKKCYSQFARRGQGGEEGMVVYKGEVKREKRIGEKREK